MDRETQPLQLRLRPPDRWQFAMHPILTIRAPAMTLFVGAGRGGPDDAGPADLSGEAGVSVMRGCTNRLLVAAAVFGTVVFPLAVGPPADAGAASSAPQEAREVRTLWTSEFGIARPAGLAYVPGMGELLVAGSKAGATPILRLGFDEDPRGTFLLSGIANPATLAYDPARRRLTAVSSRELVAAARSRFRPDRSSVSRLECQPGTRDHRGDLDPRLDLVHPDAGTIRKTNEQGAPGTKPGPGCGPQTGQSRGIAFDPLDGLIHGRSSRAPVRTRRSGHIKTYNLASLGLHHVSAMTFAPSRSDRRQGAEPVHRDAGSPSTLGGDGGHALPAWRRLPPASPLGERRHLA
jgi:hypothetical protein